MLSTAADTSFEKMDSENSKKTQKNPREWKELNTFSPLERIPIARSV